MSGAAVLEVRDLHTHLPSRRGLVRAVNGVGFSVARGEIVGVVGESGCGKSTLCFSIARLLPESARVSGQIVLDGEDLLAKSPRAMQAIRGKRMTMVLQNPMTALDPVFTVGDQLRDILRHKQGVPRGERTRRALELLREVHIPAPAQRLDSYPHQMSGGMKQRVVIAMATAPRPSIILADEPTTALDVTVQEQILALFREIRDETGTAILIVTHDLGIVRRLCDRVLIMYAGRLVESGPTEAIFRAPRHPYTRALLASLPRIGETRRRLPTIEGRIPDLVALRRGCDFAERCGAVEPACREQLPPIEALAGDRNVRCLRHEALAG